MVDQTPAARAGTGLAEASGKEARKLLGAWPQKLECGCDLQQERQVCLSLLTEVLLFTNDKIRMVPDAGGRLFPAHAWAVWSLLVGFLAGTPATLLASFVALPLAAVLDRPHPVPNQLLHLLDAMQDTPLRLAISPVPLQTVLGEGRAIGQGHLAREPPIFEGWYKRVHLVLVLVLNPCEGHRQVAQRIGGTQHRPPTSVDCIKTQHPRKVGPDAIPAGLQVDLLLCPQATSMDRAQRQRQAVIFLPPAAHQLIRHPLANHGIGDSGADFVGIPTSRRHTRQGGLEILATCTSSLIPANFRVHPGSAMQRRSVRKASEDHWRAFALLAALRTGVMLGLDRVVLHII